MKKYVHIDVKTGRCIDIGEGKDIQFYKEIGMTEQEVEQSDKEGCWYLKGYAPMKTDEERAQQEAECRMQEIKSELYELDLQAIRPLRAILSGTHSDEDLEKIKEIETKAKELRIEMQF